MEQLVERAQQGDSQAEEELFKFLLVRFRRFALRKVGAGYADEVAQEACVTIHRKYKAEIKAREFEPWAYGVLKMTVQRHYQREGRRRDRETSLPEHFELPARPDPPPLLRKHLGDCLEWLAGRHLRYARIFHLHWQGFTTQEVCEEIHVTREQYYVYLGRSRSMLRDCLQEKGIGL